MSRFGPLPAFHVPRGFPYDPRRYPELLRRHEALLDELTDGEWRHSIADYKRARATLLEVVDRLRFKVDESVNGA